jgi:hypothetical protein
MGQFSKARGPPVPWRTQWDPYQAVGRFPPFACAPSVPHVECAAVSPPHLNPRGNGLNPVHVHAAAPLSISRNPVVPWPSFRATWPEVRETSTSISLVHFVASSQVLWLECEGVGSGH